RVLLEAGLHRAAIALDEAHRGDVELREVAPGRVALLAQLVELALEVTVRHADRTPSVGPLRDALERVLIETADEHRRPRLLDRFRIAADRRELDVLAFERRFILRPQLAHGGDVLGGLGPAPGEVDAEEFRFLAQPSGADTEQKTPAGEGVERRDLLCRDDR